MNAYAIRATTGPLSRYNQATAPTILDAHELAAAFSRVDFGLTQWAIVDRHGGAEPYAVYQSGQPITEDADDAAL
jgi:hypothetical protein